MLYKILKLDGNGEAIEVGKFNVVFNGRSVSLHQHKYVDGSTLEIEVEFDSDWSMVDYRAFGVARGLDTDVAMTRKRGYKLAYKVKCGAHKDHGVLKPGRPVFETDTLMFSARRVLDVFGSSTKVELLTIVPTGPITIPVVLAKEGIENEQCENPQNDCEWLSIKSVIGTSAPQFALFESDTQDLIKYSSSVLAVNRCSAGAV